MGPNDPNGDYNILRDREAHQTALRNLVETMRACGEVRVNWAKVQKCRQRIDEHPSDFWRQLWQALLKHGGR